jgi:hypothetical protein
MLAFLQQIPGVPLAYAYKSGSRVGLINARLLLRLGRCSSQRTPFAWADRVAKDCNKSSASSSDRPKARASDVIARASMKAVRGRVCV